MVLVVGTKLLHNNLQLILCIVFHGLGLLARVVAKNFNLPLYLNFRSVHVLLQFLLQIFPVISLQ
jgi:hypothetical protein